MFIISVNCWNIENVIKNATVSFSKADLSEGTIATVECEQGRLVGASQLECVAGVWSESLPFCDIAAGGMFINVISINFHDICYYTIWL